ncbi:MAG: DUF4197 domain-containing protein [Arcobacteraceae bacterium]
MSKNKILSFLALTFIASQTLTFASWQDMGKGVLNTLSNSKTQTTNSSSNFSTTEISEGLKEALKQGVNSAITQLGKENGYLNNPLTKIPLPENIQLLESAVRKVNGDKYADDLIKAMNDSASQAALKTSSIFINAIAQMNIKDATTLLNGKENAATTYFKTNTYTALKQSIQPIIENSMKENQLASYYKTFNEFYKNNAKQYVANSTIGSLTKTMKLDAYLPQDGDENLEEYVTNKAIDGLFKMIEEEEKQIRENPMGQTSSIIKKIFSK